MPVVTLTYANSVLIDGVIQQADPTTAGTTGTVLNVGTLGTAQDVTRSLIQFDMGLIPNDAIINLATLNLYQTNATGSTRTLEFYPTTQKIDASVTWNTAPTYDSTKKVTASFSGAAAGARTVDVTTIVQAIVNGQAYGFILKDSVEGQPNTLISLASSENSNSANRPTLTIDYTIPSTGKKQVEYVGASAYAESTVGATSFSVAIPASAQDGDLLVAFLVTGGPLNYTLPTGWTEQIKVNNNGQMLVATKTKTPSDTGSITIGMSTAAAWGGYMMAFRNVKAIHAKNAVAVTPSTVAFTPGSITATVDRALCLLLNTTGTANISWTPPLSSEEKLDSADATTLNLQMSQRYFHSAKTLSSSEVQSVANSSTTGVAGYMLLEPYTNNLPTLTLTSPTDNLTLVEGNTYPIAGTATDADSGNVVTVKYKIDNGTAYNLTASVSDGTTPINFSKTLTYLNNRLYDGQNPVTPILDENVTHTLTVWAEDDQGGKSPDTTRNFTVLYNQPPEISGSDQDLGTITAPPSIQYSVTDVEGYSFTITEAVDGNTIRTFPGVDGQQETLTIPLEMWITLEPGVTHQLTITATDQYNATSVRTYTFIRAVEGIELETTEILPADAQPSRVILSLNGTIPANANLNVQVCNNAHDPSPTWEDMTQSVINGRPYVFTNTTSTTGQWGIRFKISILPGA